MNRSAPYRGLILPSLIIGVGLSGFFDGILLHQVLQWHHLLSLVPGEPFRDIGTQILADGRTPCRAPIIWSRCRTGRYSSAC